MKADMYQVWLHLSIDSFKPMSMKKSSDKFYLHRMLPPHTEALSRVYFFFSYAVPDNDAVTFVDQEHELIKLQPEKYNFCSEAKRHLKTASQLPSQINAISLENYQIEHKYEIS